jgi:hypothetical protein
MPRFYFHLSAPDEDFPDNIGSDVSDLADAHSRAVLLAKRVTMFWRFADRAPDLRRWTVNVTDERRRPVFTVIFPTNSILPVVVGGARALLMRLDGFRRRGPTPSRHRPARVRAAGKRQAKTLAISGAPSGGP